ncbi:MAG TPA: T9SS type A sorting domain-containing protein [Bacteroidia bacterium]|nr:T9SS type A sorting domain-containing protein [Bacteroidia bacterium]
MKKLLFIVLLFGFKQINAQCNNTNFETGDFSGWTGSTGYNANSNMPLTLSSGSITSLGVNSPEPGCSFHTIMTAAGGTDPYGGFPVIGPNGGNFSCRLGGENINTNNGAGIAGCTVNYPSGTPYYYSNGESLQQTFTVTASNALFTYNYAVVMAKAPHPNGQQPYFKIEVLDSSNILIPCLSYNIQGDSSGNYPPGFIDNGGGVEILAWSTKSMNLMPYVGHNVTVRFTAAGCIPGGHFSYAYIDCSCSAPPEITIPTTACPGGTDSLIAPLVAGGTYTWTGPGIVSGANAQIATANVAGVYSVAITNPAGCTYSIDTTLHFNGPTMQITSYTNSLCAGNTTTLTASGATSYTWNTNETTATISITPTITTTYTVTGAGAGGCVNTTTFTQTVTNCSTTGFNQLADEKEKITIYPNPTNSNITIQANTELGAIIVYNYLGEIVLQTKSKNKLEQIDVSKFAAGVYTIQTQNKFIKLIKE